MNVSRRGQLVQPPRESLPYPPVQQVLMRVIEHALAEAWRRLLDNGSLDLAALANAHEDAFTDPLVTELERMRYKGEMGLTVDRFAAVIRAEELWNHAHDSVAKPDIIVRLVPPAGLYVDDPRYYAVIIEAKIIDTIRKTAKRTTELYCSQGVVPRFVEGAYAWKMRQAMMCAYVLDGSKLMPSLGAEFQAQPSVRVCAPLQERAGPQLSRVERADSVHDRKWTYAAPNAGSPGPVALSHLWLRP